MRKLSVLFILAALAAGLWTGCQRGDRDGRVTIRFSMWDTVDESVNFIQAFQQANPDIRIQLVNIPEDYSTVINTMVMGGTAPDVILSWEVDMPRFAANGAIIPLGDYMANSSLVNGNDFIPAVNALSDVTEGELYGIPWVYAGHFLYFNKDMFDAAGVAYPTDSWTWNDMEAAARALTIRNGNNVTQWGITAIDFPGIWYSMIGQAGDDVIDGNMRLALGNGLRRTLEFQNRLTNELNVAPRPAAGAVIDLFANGTAAMTRQGNWFIAGYRDLPFNWDIVPLPRDVRAHTSLHTGFFTINSASRHKEEAWRFIEFMMSHRGQTLLSEFSANPSAIMSVAAEGAFKVQGTNGPRNWGAFNYFNEYGRFTYTLVNATVTNNLVNQFNSVLLGINTVDRVVDVEVPNAQVALNQLGR